MTSRSSLLPQLYSTIKETGNMTFVVGSDSTEFKAHTFIIANLAKPLYDIAMIEAQTADDTNDESVVVLEDTDEHIFSAILDSLYIGKMPDKLKSVEEGKRIIIACDKFGCFDLKLHVEELLVGKHLSVKNAMDLLLFAEAHTCPVLKIHTMSTYKNYPKQVMDTNKDDWSSIGKDPKLLLDLLWYTNIDFPNRRTYSSSTSYSKDHYKRFNPADLIKVLRKWNLDIDGSREILLERIIMHLDTKK